MSQVINLGRHFSQSDRIWSQHFSASAVHRTNCASIGPKEPWKRGNHIPRTRPWPPGMAMYQQKPYHWCQAALRNTLYFQKL